MSQTWTQVGSRSCTVVCTTGSESFPAPAKATVTVAFAAAVAGNTVTLRGLTFTAIANGATPAAPTEFPVGTGGTANTDTGTAFVAALARTVSIHGCTGVNASGTVTVTAGVYGPDGHYAITKVGTPITLGAAALAGGVAPVGMFVDSVAAVIAQVYATTAGQTLAGGKYVWAYWSPSSGCGAYLPVWAMDDAGAASATRGGTLVGPSAGFGGPLIYPGEGYLAILPSGVTISSGTLTLEMRAYKMAASVLAKTV